MTTQTLESRIARYERIIAMRGPAEAPTMSLDDIGSQFKPPLSRQRVQQIIDGGMPKRNGRPRSADRVAAARKTLALWEQRRANRAAKGLDTTNAEARITVLSNELAAMESR